MLSQPDILSILNEVLDQSARLRKGGIQATYHCPFCIDKNLATQKLEISIGGDTIGYYHCWRCNTKGKSFGSLLKKLNASKHYYDEIFKLTGDIKVKKIKSEPKTFSSVSLPPEFQSLAKQKTNPEYKNAMAYLTRRGITPDDILRYNIGYCEDGDYAYHIIIPSYDAKGTLNFFVGRRYYHVEGAIPHKKPPCSMDIVGFELFINYDEPLNLVEGVFDAIAVRNNAIPLFGKHISSKLRESMILNGTRRVNMILDNDAMEDAVKNCQTITRLGIDVHLVKLDKKDPSILGFNNIHSLIRNSPQFDFDDLLEYNLGKI
jgi:hypothetical protein